MISPRATKLTEAQAIEIYQRKALSKTIRDQARELSTYRLAEKFDLNRETIRRLSNGMRGDRHHPRRTPEDAALIRDAMAERDRLLAIAKQHTSNKIAADYGVSRTLVDRIFEGSSWVWARQ